MNKMVWRGNICVAYGASSPDQCLQAYVSISYLCWSTWVPKGTHVLLVCHQSTLAYASWISSTELSYISNERWSLMLRYGALRSWLLMMKMFPPQTLNSSLTVFKLTFQLVGHRFKPLDHIVVLNEGLVRLKRFHFTWEGNSNSWWHWWCTSEL